VAGAILLLRGQTSSYRVAAIFDTAKGMVAGQQVKIAGAVVGTVEAVDLVAGPKARIVLSLQRRFEPFHQNATCTILPEGVISENFIQCDPGSPRLPVLSDGADRIPTVPISHTTVPASLQDLLNVFSIPTDDRLRVLISELGIATAGRGQDLNALLERSNPALTQAERILSIIDAQRAQLATGVQQTGRVLAALSRSDWSVREFVDRAAVLFSTTAAHHGPLEQSIARLPALLAALRPGLRSVNRAMVSGTPLLRSLQTTAPELLDTTNILPRFLGAGTRAVRGLASAAAVGRTAVRAANPTVRDLRSASTAGVPFAEDLDKLLLSTRNGGGLDGIARTFYSLATNYAAYDQTSHLFGAFITLVPQCLSNPNAAGCGSDYTAPGHGTIPPNDPACGPHDAATWNPPTNCMPSGTAADSARRHDSSLTPRQPPRTPGPTAAASKTAASPKSSRSAASLGTTLAHLLQITPPPVGKPAPSSVQRLLQYLLGS
jgi:virulence factor Mce-like protein